MEMLIYHIEECLKDAQSFGDKQSFVIFGNQAFGAVYYFCLQYCEDEPELVQKVSDLWATKYLPQFEKGEFGD